MSTKPGPMPVSILLILFKRTEYKQATNPLLFLYQGDAGVVSLASNTIVFTFVWNLPVSIESLFLMS